MAIICPSQNYSKTFKPPTEKFLNIRPKVSKIDSNKRQQFSGHQNANAGNKSEHVRSAIK
jgi:hypothetical protein